jgi:hypothetical protein
MRSSSSPSSSRSPSLWVTCVCDLIFTRHDISGWTRAAWLMAIIFLPALRSLAYIVFGGLAPQHVSGESMTSPRDEAMRMTGRTP